MPVQAVYKFAQDRDDRCIVAGTIDSVSAMMLYFYPSGKKSNVKSIEVFNAEKPQSVSVGNAVGSTFFWLG
ncbi:hypothetical protein HQN89_36290 [Paenibacillus frigoriresistens]|nr:hypothetical protein [Paenibacillus frigoriresistens]